MSTNLWLELGKIILPAAAVFLAVYYVIKTFIDRELKKEKLELKLANHKIITPLRLQAYERLVLFLERITPENLILRVFQPGMTAEQLHKILLQTVRSEFEHNLSQQVYISNDAWEAVKTAKESILKLINLAASSEKGKKNAQELSKLIIEAYAAADENPLTLAIETLKNELHEQIL